MTPRSAVLMAEYNRWMNRRMFDAALGLPAAEAERDRGAFFGSLGQTLNHIAVADSIWLHRFAQHPDATALRSALVDVPVPGSLRQPMAPSLPALRIFRSALDEHILGWARSLTETQLGGSLHYANLAGVAQSKPFAVLVLHFFNHQTHHRGQASTLLFQAGVDVGVTDLVAFVPGEA
jgi:uncharacterized damage-inducible protein DinB